MSIYFILIPIFFIIIASIFDAIRDTLWGHFETSVFKNLNYKFWNGYVSWKYNQKGFLGYRVDAWHIFKSLYVIFKIFGIIGYAVLYSIIFYIKITFLSILIHVLINTIIIGLLYVLIFNLFYNKILYRPIKHIN